MIGMGGSSESPWSESSCFCYEGSLASVWSRGCTPFCKGASESVFQFCGPQVSFTTIQPCSCNVKAATDKL